MMQIQREQSFDIDHKCATSAIVRILDYQLPPLAEVEHDGTRKTRAFLSGLRHFFIIIA
jgi:hypothetical protein